MGSHLPQLVQVGAWRARGAHGFFGALDAPQSFPSCAVFHLCVLPERSLRKILLVAASKLPFNLAMVGLFIKFYFIRKFPFGCFKKPALVAGPWPAANRFV